MFRINTYLKEVIGRGGSDLHLSSNSPPIMRLYGNLHRLDKRIVNATEAASIIDEILTEEQKLELSQKKNIDFALEIPIGGNPQRFRCNVYYQRYGVDGVFRVIPSNIPTVKELNLPESLNNLATSPEGLVLIAGSAGSGKTTTLASLINLINNNYKLHIITIEDPIEFVLPIKKCLINQRQVGIHAKSFSDALKAAIREDPDIIVVGELRDLDTMKMAIMAAETGHCVFGTIHTTGAAKTIDRIVDSHPADQQQQIRTILSDSLRGIVYQQLLLRADGWGLIPATEILICNRAVSNIIREGKTIQIQSIMQTGKSSGMQLMDADILRLLQEGKITVDNAYEHAVEKKAFEPYFKKGEKIPII